MRIPSSRQRRDWKLARAPRADVNGVAHAAADETDLDDEAAGGV
jgi:hypothetical protein